MPAFFFSVLYTFLSLLSPGDWFPALSEARLNVIAAILAIISLIAYSHQCLPFHRSAIFLMQLGLIAGIGLSRIANGWLLGSIFDVMQYLPVALPMFLVAATTTTLQRMGWLRNAIVLVAVIFTVKGIFDLYTDPTNSLFIHGADPGDYPDGFVPFYRLRGLGKLNDPNDFAQYLVVSISLLFGFARPRGTVRKIFVTFIQLLLLAGLYFTHSRGGMLGLFTLVALTAWDRWRWIGFSVVGAVGALGFQLVTVVAGNREISVDGGSDRIELWSSAFAEIRNARIFGHGIGTATDLLPMTTHNSYLLSLLELGFFGTFFWVGMIVLSLYAASRIATSSNVALNPELVGESAALRSWAIALRNSLAVYLVTSFFLSRTYHSLIAALVGAVIALSLLSGLPATLLRPREAWFWAFAGTAASWFLPYGLVVFAHLRGQ